MTKNDRRVIRLILIGAILVGMVAQMCMLLWGGMGAFSQWERAAGLVLCLFVLLMLLWVRD